MAPPASRPGWPFWTALGGTAFGLNWVWEMVQMSAFVEMASRPWAETLWPCALAALGDVALTAAVCGVGGLAAGSVTWPATGRWNVYLTAAALGAVCGAAFEWHARATGRWSYSGRMPVVPGLGVGLWPLLQLALAIPAALWVARRWGTTSPAAGSE